MIDPTPLTSRRAGETRRREEVECGETLRLIAENESFPPIEGRYYQRLVHRIFTRSSRDPLLFANSPAFRPASARASRLKAKRYSS